MKSLENKVALVTGASSGIGLAIAKLFASEGAKVVLVARRKAELETLAKEIEKEGGEALPMPGDVQDESFAQAVVESAVGTLGRLDIAINNAGILGGMRPLTELSLEDWNHTLAVNLTGPFLGAKHQVQAMLKAGGGSLVFTSSFVGHQIGFPNMSDYAASKAGLVGLSRTIAAEYGAQGIRSNVIMTGGTDTPMGRSVANTPEIMDSIKGLYALKRIAQPEEIAQSALFLASEASSFVTGTAMFVEGGVSMNRS